jgi:hypothetical protein
MGVLSPGDMLPEHEFGSVPLSSAVVKNECCHTCAPIACLLVLDRDNIKWTCLHEIKQCDGKISLDTTVLWVVGGARDVFDCICSEN